MLTPLTVTYPERFSLEKEPPFGVRSCKCKRCNTAWESPRAPLRVELAHGTNRLPRQVPNAAHQRRAGHHGHPDRRRRFQPICPLAGLHAADGIALWARAKITNTRVFYLCQALFSYVMFSMDATWVAGGPAARPPCLPRRRGTSPTPWKIPAYLGLPLPSRDF